MNVNKVTIAGNLGNDPILNYTSNAKAVANLSVATNRVYKDAEGKQHKDTQWHRVVVWGKTAENCKKYLSKGRSVYVEGRLQTRSFEDKDGVKRWTVEVVAERVQFGPRTIASPVVEEADQTVLQDVLEEFPE